MIHDDGFHLFVTHEKSGGHLRVLDVSDPMNISIEGIFNPWPQSSIHNVLVDGDVAYCSWYVQGTRILDASDFGNLTEIGFLDTSEQDGVIGGNWGVYPFLPSGTIASTDILRGLILFRYDEDAGEISGTVTRTGDGVPLENATVHHQDHDKHVHDG